MVSVLTVRPSTARPLRQSISLPTTELDPKERLLKANAVMHDFVWGNQMQMQLVLTRLLDQAAGASNGRRELRRHNRRTKFIRTALAPARDRLDKSTYLKLCAALALVISTESMVVFRDVLQIEEAEVRVVEEWMIRVLDASRTARIARQGRQTSPVYLPTWHEETEIWVGPPPSGRIVVSLDRKCLGAGC